MIVISDDDEDGNSFYYGRGLYDDDQDQDEDDDSFYFDHGNHLAKLAASIPFCPNNDTTEGST